MERPHEPFLTPRLQRGFGLLAFGLGLMFFAGKVLPAPVAYAIAFGIVLAVTGFVLVIVEAVREPVDDATGGSSGPDASPRDGP